MSMPDRIDADWPTLDVISERYFDAVMRHVSQNRRRAAQILGVDRRTVMRMLARRRAGGALFRSVEPAPRPPRRAPRRDRDVPPARVDAVLDGVLGGHVAQVASASAKPSWRQIKLWGFEGRTLSSLVGNRRLRALLAWKDGRPERSVWYMRGGRELTSADDVDWTHFPEELVRQLPGGQSNT